MELNFGGRIAVAVGVVALVAGVFVGSALLSATASDEQPSTVELDQSQLTDVTSLTVAPAPSTFASTTVVPAFIPTSDPAPQG